MFYLLCISAQDIWKKFYGDISYQNPQQCPSSIFNQETGNYLFYHCNFGKSTSITIGKQSSDSDTNSYDNNVLFAYCKFGSANQILLSGNSCIITNACMIDIAETQTIFDIKSQSVSFFDSFILSSSSSIITNSNAYVNEQKCTLKNINVSKCIPDSNQAVLIKSKNLLINTSIILNSSSQICLQATNSHLELNSATFLYIKTSSDFAVSDSLTLFNCNFINITADQYIFYTEKQNFTNCYFHNLIYRFQIFRKTNISSYGNEVYNTFNIMNSQICEIQYKDNGEQVGYDGKPVIIPKPKAEPTDMAVYMNLKRGYVHQRQIIV